MSSSLRRGGLGAAAIALSIAPLSACAAGNDAQTLEIKPDNAATSVGDIKIQNATVITQPGTDTKGPAVVAVRIFNNGKHDETLKGVTLPGKATAHLAPAKGEKGPLVVPAGGSLALGGKGNASAVIEDGRKARDGSAQKVVFDFSSTGDVSLRALVVPAKHYFKDWGPSEVPGTPTGSPSTPPSGKPSGTPSGSATASPGGAQGGQNGNDQNQPPNGKPSGTPSGTGSPESGGDAIVDDQATPTGGAAH